MASLAIIGTGQPRKFASTRFANVGFWHETDMPMQSPFVRCWGNNRPSSVAARRPSLTLSGRSAPPAF
jgi:hypothetical protein